ncbi:sulfurtransferase complex subunit TusD [Larsenimonas suaedae]|uniref:Sulfurtransferase complex subunit TusD n=1 Tax=Larsenimonas suaedae TaxID=1851019 RepID=A0ABU1GX87_9GAMM|nr:sulfurtransferase complex subunit TusD [Larsenimonas suaedae]MCM2971403.1 sulfurtransferase complex subunit TusD [Larsenimonas suaedae]MDR5896659.1 sulfurtransferase complex subunit TusD [Larsenimonas suaedae]
MKYTLIVYGAPYSSQAAHSALRFARALPGLGHTVATVFFYHDGVYNASTLITPPQDEPHLNQAWAELKTTQGCELLVCVAAALKRGVMNDAEARRHGGEVHNLGEPFELTGVGQLLASAQSSDRTVTFAP